MGKRGDKLNEKTQTWVLLGAVAIGGYILYKTFGKGLSDVGNAVGGIATGAGNVVGTVEKATQDTLGNLGKVFSDVTGTGADLTGALRTATNNVVSGKTTFTGNTSSILNIPSTAFNVASNPIINPTLAVMGSSISGGLSLALAPVVSGATFAYNAVNNALKQSNSNALKTVQVVPLNQSKLGDALRKAGMTIY